MPHFRGAFTNLFYYDLRIEPFRLCAAAPRAPNTNLPLSFPRPTGSSHCCAFFCFSKVHGSFELVCPRADPCEFIFVRSCCVDVLLAKVGSRILDIGAKYFELNQIHVRRRSSSDNLYLGAFGTCLFCHSFPSLRISIRLVWFFVACWSGDADTKFFYSTFFQSM